MKTKLRVLFADIETSPLKVFAWQLKNFGHTPVSMLSKDRRIISFAGKFQGESKIYQFDTRKGLNNKNEKKLLKKVGKLLDQADLVVTQNGKKFDVKLLRGRFVFYRLKPFKSFEQFDTLTESKRLLNLPSYSLEYVSDTFCRKYKKLQHKKFPGVELWKACLSGVKSAWREMAKYNIHDILTLEEWYGILLPYFMQDPKPIRLCKLIKGEK